MTTNLELDQIINKLDFKNKYLGCYSRDQLNELKCPDNYFLISNTDSSEHRGSHWTMLWKQDKTKIFFCSFGSRIFNEAKQLLGNNVLCSTFRIQDWGSVICGELCILVAYLLDKGIQFEDIILELVKIEENTNKLND